MFSPFYLFYFGLLIFAATLAYIAYKKGDKKSMVVLLILTLLFEVLALILNGRYVFLYDLFIPTEYMLFCLYYWKSQPVIKTKRWAMLSVACFFVFSIAVAFMVFQSQALYMGLVTWNIDLEGFLLFIVFTHLLFNIDDEISLPIYKIPEFWVSVGVLIFYGGVFTILGLYPILLHVDPATAAKKYGFFLNPLNVILYVCIISGSICFLQNRKFLIQ